MTDSPAVRAPLDPTEQPVLDQLLGVRTQLELLRADKSTYVKSEDVIRLYNQLMEQVEKLNGLRIDKRLEQNRVDTVLDDCFQLISLAYMAIGKNHEAPATYSAVSTMKRLLDHLWEAAFFSPKDLDGVKHRLEEYRSSVERGKETYSPHLLTLLEARINVCQQLLNKLNHSLEKLSPELKPTYEKLVSILRSLSACNTKSKYPASEVKALHEQLKAIEAELHAEKTVDKDLQKEDRIAQMMQHMQVRETEDAPEGDEVVTDLLTRCFLWHELIEQKQGKINERFEDAYKKLLNIRGQLEKLQLTQAWSLRETDLYSFQRQLDRIDESRVDGNFQDSEGKPADIHAQRTLLYLLRKSYSIIYFLIISSEPVSEALLPIYNQLNTLKRCLVEVRKSGGVSSPRELYPYSMKLNSIDNMRQDGKFMIGNDIPDGQGAVNHLLAECFELAYEIRIAAEEENEEGNDEAQTQELASSTAE
ncbi:uncharacterized protein K452DRAFT_286962 [Aplosporella prunicola CBS 121167]|uniref:Uncharacterized protein n=1 Tax=Aplosporella prunicola CBS 121167 TaxID=1176127 RepID=A0A6A6BEP3_9PEZI|nr:uncharacterized protein K452DRAFT_286962 [Aplosporella prunicola CBS 121167]KAF2142536.1 hypothetical protein K452DRAFT_286962 [Aplosporella prunicola CBS 121167]